MARRVKCPVCGASVRKTELRRHMKKAHPGQSLERARKGSRGSAGFLRKRWLHISSIAAVLAISIGLLLFLEARKTTIATFETNMGTFKVELDTERAPITAGNFIELAKAGFYNGLTFHRVARNFVIQGGDPNGNGTGGSGKNIPWENTTLKNKKYTISMARGGNPNEAAYSGTASSQFFINLKDNPNLDSYAFPFVVFGKVIEGFDVVDKIGSLYPPEGDGPPTKKVTMKVSIVTRYSLISTDRSH